MPAAFHGRLGPALSHVALALLGLPALAQPQAPVYSSAPDKDIVQLSPFEVSTTSDVGWVAGNTLLSNRTNQPLKDVPVTIDGLTQEFLLDMGAFDALSAGEWVANVSITPENSGVGGSPAPDTNRYAFRGIANEGGPTRNLFQWLAPSDTYNVERIDFGRGSNSLLFGDVEPGGQANVYTKRALIGRSFGSGLAQVGSFDAYRVNLDYNRSLSDRLGVRLNVTKNHSERDFDYNKFDFAASHGAVTFRPFKTTVLRAEGELGRYRRVWGTNNESILERRTPGLGYTNVWTVLPDNTLVRGSTLAAIDRTAAPAGATLSLEDVAPGGFPRHYNWGGPDQIDDRDFTTFSVYLEQKLGPVSVELSYNQQLTDWGRYQVQSAYLINTDVNGRRFISYNFQDRNEFNKVRIPRAMISYNWEPLRWMSQLFVASAELREGRFGTTIYGEKYDDGTQNLNVNTNAIVYRIYVDDPNGYDVALRRRQVRRDNLPQTAALKRTMFLGSTSRGQASWERAYSLSASGTYFGGRLLSTIGARVDTANYSVTNPWQAANRNARGELPYPGTYDDHPDRYSPQAARSDLREPTQVYGLVYKLTPNVNLYAVRSTSFRAANGNDINFVGETMGQEHGRTLEIGAKSDFLQGKLIWTVNWYDLTRANVVSNYGLVGITNVQLEDLFNPNNLKVSDPGYLTVSSAREEREVFSHGYESTLIYYPGKGWNVRLSGAYKKVTQDKSMLRFKGLLAEAIARGNENLAFISAARDIVAQNAMDGAEIAAAYAGHLTANFAVNYRFAQESRFNGLSAGLSGSYAGEYVLNYINNVAIRGGSLFSFHAMAGYRRRVLGQVTTFRLNIRNINATDHLTTGVVSLSNGMLRNIHSYGQPRTFTLTTSMEF